MLRFRVPKPGNCLGLIDLQTATEVITIFTLINKVSGFYGILSLFTGIETLFIEMIDLRCRNFAVTDEHVHMVYIWYRRVFMGS